MHELSYIKVSPASRGNIGTGSEKKFEVAL